jgi:hypothetical protein
MSARHVIAVARAHARELSRRRVALAMLIALPLLFYVSASSAEGSFVLMTGGMGVAWALTGAGLFIGLGSRALAQRLVLRDRRRHHGRAAILLLTSAAGARWNRRVRVLPPATTQRVI